MTRDRIPPMAATDATSVMVPTDLNPAIRMARGNFKIDTRSAPRRAADTGISKTNARNPKKAATDATPVMAPIGRNPAIRMGRGNFKIDTRSAPRRAADTGVSKTTVHNPTKAATEVTRVMAPTDLNPAIRMARGNFKIDTLNAPRKVVAADTGVSRTTERNLTKAATDAIRVMAPIDRNPAIRMARGNFKIVLKDVRLIAERIAKKPIRPLPVAINVLVPMRREPFPA